MDSLEKIGLAGLVPVAVIENADDAVPAAQALLAAGLRVMEITMRTAAGIQAIRNVAAACPDMLVGAGTILSLEKCREAVDAGARFIVSPGFNQKIVSWCVENKVPITPGCVTPTEIEMALAFDIRTVKFFPADIYGGIRACKALYGPYKTAGISFIPTGGISSANLAEYVDKPYIHAVGGGWLCSPRAVSNHDFAAITAAARQAIDILLGFELAADSACRDRIPDSQLAEMAGRLTRLTGFPVRCQSDGAGAASRAAASADKISEDSQQPEAKTMLLQTSNISRAVHYLRQSGVKTAPAAAPGKGAVTAADYYLEDEFDGCRIQLRQK